MFLHEDNDFKAVIEQIAVGKKVSPVLVEKDYWIMHCLWGLKKQGFTFYMEGGTSLSKGFKLIDRSSEDIDIKIEPNDERKAYTGKNQNKEQHIKSRKDFF